MAGRGCDVRKVPGGDIALPFPQTGIPHILRFNYLPIGAAMKLPRTNSYIWQRVLPRCQAVGDGANLLVWRDKMNRRSILNVSATIALGTALFGIAAGSTASAVEIKLLCAVAL